MRGAGIARTAVEVISRELRLTWPCALGLAHVATAKLPELQHLLAKRSQVHVVLTALPLHSGPFRVG